MRLIVRIRPIHYIFKRKWYTFRRLHEEYVLNNECVRLIDCGMITFGYATKLK